MNDGLRRPAAALPALLLCLCLAAEVRADAQAQAAAEPAPTAADISCASPSWRLDGASARSDDEGTVALPPAWGPILESIAGCLERPEAARACLVVQGQHDDRQFPPAVVQVFGGQAAAQTARARSRASSVLQALGQLGVEPERLRESQPANAATWRGVEIRLRSACLAAAPELSEADRRLLEKARRVLERDIEREEAARALELERAPAPASAPPIEPFAELSLHGSLASSDAATVASPGLRLALGAKRDWLAVRLGAGAAIAAREEQQNALEAFAAIEFHPLPWLSVGPVAGVRFGAPALDAPWLERSYFAGLEAAQHLLSFGDDNHLLLQQAILPFASLDRRGEIAGGRLERISPGPESLIRFEIGLSLRHDL